MNKIKKPEVQTITEKWIDYMEARNFMKEKYPDVWSDDNESELWDDICESFSVTNGRNIDSDELSWYLEDYLGNESNEGGHENWRLFRKMLSLFVDEFAEDKDWTKFPGLTIDW